MSASNYLEVNLLDHTFRATTFTAPANCYLALYTSDPTDADSGIEATGGSYARKSITFAAAASGAISSNNAQTFSAMPAGTITHWGIRDALAAGNLLASGAMSTPVTLSSGDTLTFASGDITITLD